MLALWARMQSLSHVSPGHVKTISSYTVELEMCEKAA